MKFLKIAAAVAVVGLAVGSASAYAADEPETALGCGHMDRAAVAAVDSNATAANVDEAKTEMRQGREACHNGFYKLGLAHYKKALSLLNAG